MNPVQGSFRDVYFHTCINNSQVLRILPLLHNPSSPVERCIACNQFIVLNPNLSPIINGQMKINLVYVCPAPPDVRADERIIVKFKPLGQGFDITFPDREEKAKINLEK